MIEIGVIMSVGYLKNRQNPANLCMLSTQKQTSQIGLFSSLADILDQKHPMYQLAGKINWRLVKSFVHCCNRFFENRISVRPL